MFKKNGKKAVAYIALLLTLIMCLGTLLEGAIAFADVDIHFTVEDDKLTVCRVLFLGEQQS